MNPIRFQREEILTKIDWRTKVIGVDVIEFLRSRVVECHAN